MKKKCFLLTALLSIILIPFTVNAEAVTKESLTAAYREAIACNKEGNYTERKYETTESDGSTSTTTIKECKAEMDYSGINMDEYITDDKIYFDKTNGGKVEVNYAIQDNGDVLFYTTHTIDNTTTYDQYNDYTSDGYTLIGGYPIVAAVKGVQYNDSSAYIYEMVMSKLFSELGAALTNTTNIPYVIVDDNADLEAEDGITVIKKSQFGNYAVEYAKAINGTQKSTMSDADSLDTFTLTMTPDVSDSSKYVITTELLVKSSKDFSGLNGTINKYISGDSGKQSADPVEQQTGENQPTAYNPKTGALLNMVPIVILLTLGIVLILNYKNYFKKI